LANYTNRRRHETRTTFCERIDTKAGNAHRFPRKQEGIENDSDFDLGGIAARLARCGAVTITRCRHGFRYVWRAGDLFVTAIDSGTIFRVSPAGASRVFGKVEGSLLGLAFDTDGTLVAVGGTSVYRFGKDGTSSLVMNIAGAQSLNGVALWGRGRFLVADDSAATVWEVDVNAGTAKAWLTGSLLTPPPDGLPIGPNGIKFFRGAVYISITGAGTLLRVPIKWNGSAGAPEVIASSFQVDDFAFGADGSIFAATQNGEIIHLHPNGSRTTIATGTFGDAAVAFGHTLFDFRDIYVVNNGGAFLDLPDGPVAASIVRLVANVPGALAGW
jgi:hypothetical protein